MTPKISVIIPIYNVEPYLRECLDSVINQTFRDLEIICVNDGSTDGSAAILEDYAAKDSRIKVITKENGGLNTARNAGLDNVSGEYFAIVDSDDWLDVTAYEKAYSRAKESGADMTLFYFTLVDFPNKKDVAISDFPKETEDQTEKIQHVGNTWSVCWCYLWKTDFVKKNNLRFYNELQTSTEITFTFKAALLADKIAIVPERLYYYRFRSTSLTGNTKSTRFLQRPLAFILLFQDIKDCNVSEESWLKLYQMKWGCLYDTYYNVIDKRFRFEMRHRIKQSITDVECMLINAHEKLFAPDVFSFFVKFARTPLQRLLYNCNKFRDNFFDWLAKRLIPSSPWLQQQLEKADNQREEIKKLQNQLLQKRMRDKK